MIPPLQNEPEIRDLIEYLEKGSYNFNFPIIKNDKEWDADKKAEFIYGILKFYPVGSPIIAYEDRKECYIIDGKKRLEYIFEYKNNKFKLPEAVPEFECFDCNAFPKVVSLKFDISGKCYDELPSELKEIYLNSCMTILFYDSKYYTKDEMQEIYNRINL